MIALGSDQAGYELKQEIKKHLEERGLSYKDYGSYDPEPVDYPVYGKKVGRAVADGECDRGILICGTGIGISIAANKIKGVRAAVCSDCFSAEATRLHNDANAESRHDRRIIRKDDGNARFYRLWKYGAGHAERDSAKRIVSEGSDHCFQKERRGPGTDPQAAGC